jgi:TonB family protein
MSDTVLSMEMSVLSTRTRQFVGVSVVVHLLLLSWFIIERTFSPPAMGITEIVWVQPAAVAVPEETAPPVAQKTTQLAPIQEVVTAKPSKAEPVQHFRRELKRGAVEPRPQKQNVTEDKLKRKLESLQRNKSNSHTRVAAVTPPVKVGKPTLAGVGAENPTTNPYSELTREDAPRGKPIELKRVEGTRGKPAVAAPVVPKSRVTPAQAEITESTARRELAGAQLVGPVADRPVVKYETPEYPEWAKRDGVEGSVTLYFVVRPNGWVKENVLVQKTSGFQDFDQKALIALMNWRFQPLEGGATGEQWGSITFHFKLSHE